MKNLIILACLMIFATQVEAQFHIKIKLGASPGSNTGSAATLVNRENPFEEFQFNLVHTDPQYQGGVSAYLPLGAPFFLEAGISYTKRKSQFEVDYTFKRELQPDNVLMNGSEEMILVPVNIGVAVGAFDITSGLRAIQTISNSSDLEQLDGFLNNENTLKMGWQMGVRYAFHHMMLGVEYQATMNRVCEGMSVNGHSLEIMNVPGAFVFSIQYKF